VGIDCDSQYEVLTFYGFYHRDIDRLLKHLLIQIQNEIVFFDVGANIGFVSLLACSNPNLQITAHGFEPNPFVFERLQANTVLNPFSMVINNFALGSKAGQSELSVGKNSGNSTLIKGGFSHVNRIGTIQVEIHTLDNYCLNQAVFPNIMKIDVEGYEQEVLNGGTGVIAKSRPFLIIEMNSKALKAAGTNGTNLLRLLASLNYQCYFVKPRREINSSLHLKNGSTWNGYPEIVIEEINQEYLFDILGVPAEYSN